MNVQERVYQALRKDAALAGLLARDRRGPCIYHGKSPDAGSYPVLVYSVVSDVPALSADGEEIERRVTVRVHILTKDGAADAIEGCVMKRMKDIGFRRAQSVEFAEKNMFVKAIDFRIGTGVEA